MNKQRNLILGLVTTVLMYSASAMATPLNLTLADEPDFVIGFITTTYTPNVFMADGFPMQLSLGGNNETVTDGIFALDAGIGPLGFFAGGSFAISGTIGSLGYNSGTLLTGDLTALGFDESGGGVLEFLFEITGGDAAALFANGTGGIIMADTGFTGTWDQFSSFSASADLAALPMPEPGILLLQALGLTLLLVARRRRT